MGASGAWRDTLQEDAPSDEIVSRRREWPSQLKCASEWLSEKTIRRTYLTVTTKAAPDIENHLGPRPASVYYGENQSRARSDSMGSRRGQGHEEVPRAHHELRTMARASSQCSDFDGWLLSDSATPHRGSDTFEPRRLCELSHQPRCADDLDRLAAQVFGLFQAEDRGSRL